MLKTPEDRLTEVQLYEVVAEELENNQQSKGLWAKAIADSAGDHEKIEALYIKSRVQMIKDVKKSFNTACRRLGIENFHIHDLRHTFASWLVMEGVPLFEVSKLLRHASIQMTERYAHLAPDYLHDAVASLGFSARFQHTENPLTAVVSKNG